MRVIISWRSSTSLLPSSDHPSIDLMFIVLIICLASLGALCVFYKPAYPDAVNAIIAALISLLGGAGGAKYALSVQKSKVDNGGGKTSSMGVAA